MKPITDKAYKLLHQGVIALSQVEANGIRIDTNYLNQAMTDTGNEIKRLEGEIKNSKVCKVWRKQFGQKTNLNSGQQLGKVLFDIMGYECSERTGTGIPKTNIEALEKLDISFVKDHLQIKQLKKARGTYLKGILREVSSDGFVHAVFNLHLVQTYRGSCDSPNIQNQPIRDYDIGKLIRQCFIPRNPYNHIVEVDYGGIEVHGAQWYHKDPAMLKYICDPTKDMHKDMSQQCYILPKREMKSQGKKDAKRIKDIRYSGKNGFVFPEFYGDWFYDCAPALWNNIEKLKLKTRDGVNLYKYLKTKGICELGSLKKVRGMNGKWNYPKPTPGTFIHHIKKVEYDFWNNRFKVYKQWKDDWYKAYCENGGFDTLTGFHIEGEMKRNEVINYPIQGTAFHCLLWSLIRIQKLLKKYRMKSLLIGQIHDSIIADVPRKELSNYLELVNQVMTVDIKKHYKFITTPIEIEAEVAPIGKSWFEKQKVKI